MESGSVVLQLHGVKFINVATAVAAEGYLACKVTLHCTKTALQTPFRYSLREHGCTLLVAVHGGDTHAFCMPD